jgi:hypothetical protein
MNFGKLKDTLAGSHENNWRTACGSRATSGSFLHSVTPAVTRLGFLTFWAVTAFRQGAGIAQSV